MICLSVRITLYFLSSSPWELHHGNPDNVENGDSAEDLLGGEHMVGISQDVDGEGGEGDEERGSGKGDPHHCRHDCLLLDALDLVVP